MPCIRDDLRVQRERDAHAGQEDVPDGQVEQQVVAGRPRPPRAQRGHHEQQIAQDGDHDGDHVQGDPAPLVRLVQDVAGGDVRRQVRPEVVVGHLQEVAKR